MAEEASVIKIGRAPIDGKAKKMIHYRYLDRPASCTSVQCAFRRSPFLCRRPTQSPISTRDNWRERGVSVCTSRLFAQFLFVYRMLKGMPSVCFDRGEWRQRVIRSFESAPTVKVFDIHRFLGAPSDLADSSLWL